MHLCMINPHASQIYTVVFVFWILFENDLQKHPFTNNPTKEPTQNKPSTPFTWGVDLFFFGSQVTFNILDADKVKSWRVVFWGVKFWRVVLFRARKKYIKWMKWMTSNLKMYENVAFRHGVRIFNVSNMCGNVSSLVQKNVSIDLGWLLYNK